MIDRNGKKIYNCPNCAAPIGYSDRCEYCGTVLYWIPTTYKIVTSRLAFTKLAAEAFVDKRFSEIPEGESFVYRDLKYKLAEKLPEAWSTEVRDDFYRDGKIYRAEVLIGKEENNERNT